MIQKSGCVYETNQSQIMMNVPYFEPPKKSINRDIYEQVLYLNTMPFQRGADMENLYLIPDGAITFHGASETMLNYTIQINDLRLHEYHRNNGITKISYKNFVNPDQHLSVSRAPPMVADAHGRRGPDVPHRPDVQGVLALPQPRHLARQRRPVHAHHRRGPQSPPQDHQRHRRHHVPHGTLPPPPRLPLRHRPRKRSTPSFPHPFRKDSSK